MPDNQDTKFLKYRAKILAVNTGDQPDRLKHDITVPLFRGFAPGEVIKASDGWTLQQIIDKEFNSTPPTPKVTITVVGSGTTNPAAGSHNVTYGGDFTLNSAVPATGYQLKDIVVDGETKTAPFTIRNITADKTITVTFEESPTPKYTITTSAGANGSITPTFEVDEGANANVVITPDTNYVIDKITVDGTERDPISPSGETVMFSDVHEPHTVSATFKENLSPTVTLTIEAGMNGTVSPAGSRPVSRGSNVNQTLTASPGTGYEVDTWSLDNTVVQTGGLTYQLSLTNVQADHEVLVTFKELPAEVYHVQITDATTGLSNYGTISPAAGTTVDTAVGSTTSVTATPNSGFKIKSFKVGGTEETIADPTQAHTAVVPSQAADTTIEVIVEFEEVPADVLYSAFLQRSRSQGAKQTDPELSELTLGDPIPISVADIQANGYTLVTPPVTGKTYTQPCVIYPTTLGAPTSIKQSGQETVATWYNSTITISGVIYHMCYKNSMINTGQATYEMSWQ